MWQTSDVSKFGPGPLRVSRAIHQLQSRQVSPQRAAVCALLHTHAFQAQQAAKARAPKLIRNPREVRCLDLQDVLANLPAPVLDPVSVILPPASKRMRHTPISFDALMLEALQAVRA